MRRLIAAFALSLACIAAPALAQTAPGPEAPPPEQADRDCFRANDVHGWGLLDSQTVRVRVNAQRQYALTTDRSARRLRWSMGIVLSSASGWICVGDAPAQAEIHEVGPVVGHAWFVESVATLEDWVAAKEAERADAR